MYSYVEWDKEGTQVSGKLNDSAATTWVDHHVLEDLHCEGVVLVRFHQHREPRERRRWAARARHEARLHEVHEALQCRVSRGVHVRPQRVHARALAEPGHVAVRRQNHLTEAKLREVYEHVAPFAVALNVIAIPATHVGIVAADRC